MTELGFDDTNVILFPNLHGLEGDHPFSDVGNAQRLVARHGADLRFCHAWNRWLVWDGRRFRVDDVGEAQVRMKETARALLHHAIEGNQRELAVFALRSENAQRIRAALELAQSEPGIPVRPDDLDRNQWVLNANNGTIDLTNGHLLQHDREHLITKLAPVDYAADSVAPAFDAFLERVFPQESVRTFVQRLLGYGITGLTVEQVIAIFHGTGANGKSTLANLILELMGDYAQTAPADTFLARRETSIPNDVARLQGARIALASEIGDGRRLNEALVKRMTGGDRLSVRHMRGDWFEFTPQFLPVLLTNTEPEIRDTTEAMWRRIVKVPFTVTIPPEDRDQHLPDRLRREAAGVLRWLVEGCLAWQQDGLAPPDEVVAATSFYREEMDVIGGFLDERCELDPNVLTPTALLYDAFANWNVANGEKRSPSQHTFATLLKQRGLVNGKKQGRRVWYGIRVRSGSSGASESDT